VRSVSRNIAISLIYGLLCDATKSSVGARVRGSALRPEALRFRKLAGGNSPAVLIPNRRVGKEVVPINPSQGRQLGCFTQIYGRASDASLDDKQPAQQKVGWKLLGSKRSALEIFRSVIMREVR